MEMKLNEVVKNFKVKAYGFGAFKALEDISNQNATTQVVIATDSPAIMIERGIFNYYAPIIPRNSRYVTVDDVLTADLILQHVTVLMYPSWDLINTDKVVIVSRHKGTVNLLKGMYPGAPVLSGNITGAEIDGCHVIGTLPPALIPACQSYRAVTIRDFDYAKDGDLSGDKLSKRLVIHDPIQVVLD